MSTSVQVRHTVAQRQARCAKILLGVSFVHVPPDLRSLPAATGRAWIKTSVIWAWRRALMEHRALIHMEAGLVPPALLALLGLVSLDVLMLMNVPKMLTTAWHHPYAMENT